MTRQIHVGGIPIGGGAPVVIQSMLNTKTTDVEGSLRQLRQLLPDPMTAMAALDLSANPVVINDLAEFKEFRDAVNAGNSFSGKTVQLAAKAVADARDTVHKIEFSALCIKTRRNIETSVNCL